MKINATQYIEVEVEEKEILAEARKILSKKLPTELQIYDGFYTKKGVIFGWSHEGAGGHSYTINDPIDVEVLGKKNVKDIINALIVLENHK